MNLKKWDKLTDDQKMFALKSSLEDSIAQQLILYRDSYVELFVDARFTPRKGKKRSEKFFNGKFDPQSAVENVLIDTVRRCSHDDGLWVSQRLSELLQSSTEDYDDCR